MKEFSSEELSTFNGKEGRPVHISFEGKVYDVSKSPLWSKGIHMNRHPSGKDLSGEISAAPHGIEVFERFSQVGILKKGVPEELKHLPPFLQNLLHKFPMARRHPHPMVVHFPIALLMASSLFLLLHLLFRTASFEVTSYYLLILGALSSPFAISRISGWAAHIIEEKFAEARPKSELYRPDADYIENYCGPQACEFIPIEKRSE